MSMSYDTWTISTLTDAYSPEFGVGDGAHLVIDVSVLATGTPTGVLTLERYELDGSWDTYDTGTEAFTDPAAGAAIGGINIKNPKPGKYRVFYDRTSGGDAVGAVIGVWRGKAA